MTILTLLMVAILIGGATVIFRVHCARAALLGVTLRASDVFTRFAAPARSDAERALRGDVLRALMKFFVAFLFLNFVVGLLIPR